MNRALILALKQKCFQTLADHPQLEVTPSEKDQWCVSTRSADLLLEVVATDDYEHMWEDLYIYVRTLAVVEQAHVAAVREVEELKVQYGKSFEVSEE
jgi:hypothetical protein